jgi:AcrB/AcrD/AcrF family
MAATWWNADKWKPCALVVHGTGLRNFVRGDFGVPADGGEFPVMDGPVHHHNGAAGRAGRNHVDAFHDPDHDQGPFADGAIMCIGVATSNSILLVTFATGELKEGKSALDAAPQAGFVRLRPVIMTALAMIIGAVPMALGIGEGAQNAPLGRAVKNYDSPFDPTTHAA